MKWGFPPPGYMLFWGGMTAIYMAFWIWKLK